MTEANRTEEDLAIKAIPTTYPDFLAVEPFDEDDGDICPDPEAIVRFIFEGPGDDPTLEQHFLVCADCRIEVDAIREAFRRLGQV